MANLLFEPKEIAIMTISHCGSSASHDAAASLAWTSIDRGPLEFALKLDWILRAKGKGSPESRQETSNCHATILTSSDIPSVRCPKAIATSCHKCRSGWPLCGFAVR
jgi:hypothetical protein